MRAGFASRQKRSDPGQQSNLATELKSGDSGQLSNCVAAVCYDVNDNTFSFVDGDDDMDCK